MSPKASTRLKHNQKQWVVIGILIISAGVITLSGKSIFQKTFQNKQYYQSTTSDVINGIAVPSEPDPLVNNATIAGVDSNNNGIRDDVERVLARDFGGTSDYPFALTYAKEYQSMIVGPTPILRSEALAKISRQECAVRNASSALLSFDMRGLVINTEARRLTLRAFNDVLVGFIHRDLPPCAQ